MALLDLSNNIGLFTNTNLPTGQVNLGLGGSPLLTIGSTTPGSGSAGLNLLDGSLGVLPTTNLPTGQIGLGIGSGGATIGATGTGGLLDGTLNVLPDTSLPTGQIGVGVGSGGATVGSSSASSPIGTNLLGGMINLLPDLSLPTGPIVIGIGDAGVGVGAGAGGGTGGGGSGGGGTGGGTGSGGTGGGGTGGGGTGGGGTGGTGGTGGAGGSGGTGGTGGTGGGTGGAGGTGGDGTGAGGGPTTNPNTGGGLPDVFTAFENMFRTHGEAPTADIQAQLTQLNGLVQAGTITQAQAILQLAHAAAPVTGLAVVSYAFFTGKVPTVAGLDYLVNSVANFTDLNDAYYAPFNTENRYINFSSNLGLHGEGANAFISAYGNLSFDQAVEKAYTTIIGFDVTTNGGFASAGAVADIQSRKGFFEAVANERFGADNHDLATKLAAIGYILQEAVRAGVGVYGDATENYLFDLADGSVQGNVDLVGVYGPNSAFNVDTALA